MSAKSPVEKLCLRPVSQSKAFAWTVQARGKLESGGKAPLTFRVHGALLISLVPD
jgi:hypothetical protein